MLSPPDRPRNPARWLRLFSFIFLMAAPGAGEAQVGRTGIGGGPSFPLGVLSDAVDDGFNALLINRFGPAWPLRFQAEALFQEFPAVEDRPGRHRQLALLLSGRVGGEQPGPRPFFVAGGGVYRISPAEEGGGVEAESAGTHRGVNAGMGVDLGFLGVVAYAEARFHAVFVGDSRLHAVPVSFGLIF